MSNLKLSSSFVNNILPGVGQATLQNDLILISVEPNTSASLLRGVNKVFLLKPQDTTQTTQGRANLGDVYTLENNDNKLIIKVENEDVRHETDIFINPDPITDSSSTKRKTTLSVGVLLLIMLLVSVIFGVKQKNINEFNKKSEEKLNSAISSYEMKTRESFVNAKEIATKLKSDGYKNQKLDDLLLQISKSESEILGEVKVETKDLLDLTLQINNFNGGSMVSTGETIFVYDQNDKNIIKLDTNGKNAKIVAKKDVLDGVIGIASYQDKLFTINNDGIYEIASSKNKVKDLDWGESLFYLYSANIYMVDKGNNKIYRFSGNGKTFGDKSDWLAPGIEVDFSKVIDMTIDGSIWVLSSTGKVTRFTNGNPASMSMEGIVSILEKPTAIYTNENLKYLYILERDTGRVVVLEKSGKFKMQYISDQIKNASDLVVDEKNQKIILLSGSKLVYFEPK